MSSMVRIHGRVNPLGFGGIRPGRCGSEAGKAGCKGENQSFRLDHGDRLVSNQTALARPSVGTADLADNFDGFFLHGVHEAFDLRLQRPVGVQKLREAV